MKKTHFIILITLFLFPNFVEAVHSYPQKQRSKFEKQYKGKTKKKKKGGWLKQLFKKKKKSKKRLKKKSRHVNPKSKWSLIWGFINVGIGLAIYLGLKFFTSWAGIFLALALVLFLFSIHGIGKGIKGIREVNWNKGAYKGKGFAISGIVLNSLLFLGVIAFTAFVYILAAAIIA